jgi:hypothetical protein
VTTTTKEEGTMTTTKQTKRQVQRQAAMQEPETKQAEQAKRRAEAAEIAGYKQCQTAGSTGALIVLLDAKNGGDWLADPEDGGRWVTYCDDHSYLLQHETIHQARSWMAWPQEWCEECQAAYEAKEAGWDPANPPLLDDDASPEYRGKGAAGSR